MVEKYRGILPPGSIWYSFSREEAETFLKHTGRYTDMTPEQRRDFDSVDLQALPGKAREIEEQISRAGLNMVTLYD